MEDRTASNLTTRLQVAGVWNLPEVGSELGLRVGLEGRFTGGSNFEGSLANNLTAGRFSYSGEGDDSVQPRCWWSSGA